MWKKKYIQQSNPDFRSKYQALKELILHSGDCTISDKTKFHSWVYNHDGQVHRLSKHYSGCPHSKLIACTAIFAWIYFVFAKMIIMQNSAWIFLSHKTWASVQPKWPSPVNPLGFAYAQIMGLEGALFTFPLCTFAQKIWSSNIHP